MALFTHEDDEGDAFEVVEARAGHAGQLVFNFACRRPDISGVFLPHDRVAALHAALGEWLMYEGPKTQAPDAPIGVNSLIDQLITRRVAEEVARVLPLHLAPQAYVPEPDAEDGWEPARPHPKYEDARPDNHNRLMSNMTRMSEMAKLTAWAEVQKGAGTWGADGTSPNGPVPDCGCGHGYARHALWRPVHYCTECACPRYRSTS